MAWSPATGAGGGPGCSGAIGVIAFGFAPEASGGAVVAVLISWAESSLPLVTKPETWPLTSAVLPEPLNLVASSGFFGAAASIALATAAIKAALSKVPGLAAPILST